MSYPKWVYAKREVAEKVTTGFQSPLIGEADVVGKIIQDPDERKALGPGWADSPAGPFTSEAKPRPRGRPRKLT